VQAKDPKPLLMVDIDGVISLFGVPVGVMAGAIEDEEPAGSLHTIEGMPHFLSHAAAAHLLELIEQFELVWASGWEEKADEHLPHLLGVPADLPYLRFGRGCSRIGSTGAHWKLAAIERHAGERALAWVDDSFNDACHEWAARRQAPTLLVQTEPARGLTAREASLLRSWALALGRA
jgi:HAD domain in Swiss Army Knife RNA repair proteins